MLYYFERDEGAEEKQKEKIEEVAATGYDLFGEKNEIVWREELSEKAPAPEFNFFAISNALEKRDRRALWLNYQRALAAGISPEEIFWRALWWPVRKMRAARLSARLSALWHETKREAGRDFGLELEHFLLTV